jgi:hypothetical protein
VVFGDYQPLSNVTVDRKYFTADPIFFQDIFKSIVCMNGGIIKNAVEEGMVAALEVKIPPDQTKNDRAYSTILVV